METSDNYYYLIPLLQHIHRFTFTPCTVRVIPRIIKSHLHLYTVHVPPHHHLYIFTCTPAQEGRQRCCSRRWAPRTPSPSAAPWCTRYVGWVAGVGVGRGWSRWFSRTPSLWYTQFVASCAHSVRRLVHTQYAASCAHSVRRLVHTQFAA